MTSHPQTQKILKASDERRQHQNSFSKEKRVLSEKDFKQLEHKLQLSRFLEMPRYCEGLSYGEWEEECYEFADYIVAIRRQYNNAKLLKERNLVIEPEKPWDVYHGLCKKHIKAFLKWERSSARWHNTKQPKNAKLKQTVKILKVWQIKGVSL